MVSLKLMLDVCPSPQELKTPRPLSPEEKVRRAIELVESGYCSEIEWLMLRKLYKALCSRKQTPRVSHLKKMIEPVLGKYGYHVSSPEATE